MTLNNEYIALMDCQERKLYRLRSRNISIGVFCIEQGFIGIRTKFGRRFLDSENHWDCLQFATARPIKIIGELPIEIRCDQYNNIELFNWLEQQEKNYEVIGISV